MLQVAAPPMRSGQVLCTVFPHRETARMASLDTGRIIVIALASVLVVLLITVLVITLVMMKKRNLLCFKKNVHARPILLSDRELEARYGPKRKRKKSKNKAKSRKKEKVKYHSLGRLSSFPKSNPFANKPLENPLVDDEEFDMDWTNPAFDVEGGRLYDAAVIIQSWYRMIRYVFVCYFNLLPHHQLHVIDSLLNNLYDHLSDGELHSFI